MIRSAMLAAAAAAVLAATPVSAQSLKSLSGSALSRGSASVDSNALVSDLASGTVSIGGAENAAGTLAYCQKQGFTSGGVSSVKNKLLSQLGGVGAIAQNAGYASGLAGMLQAGDGASFDLTSLKGAVGRKVCSTIAERAVSAYLGG